MGKKAPNKFVVMEMISDEYGWTPKEIREQSYIDIKEYVNIISMKRKIENKNNKK